MKKIIFMVALFLVFSVTIFSNEREKEALKEIGEIVKTIDEKALLEEEGKMSLTFYPMYYPFEIYNLGLEIPINNKTSIDVEIANYIGIEEDTYNSAQEIKISYRKYSSTGLRKGFAGVFIGYNFVDRKDTSEYDVYYYGEEKIWKDTKSGPTAGVEVGYKGRIVDNIYISNSMFLRYYGGTSLITESDKGMQFGFDLLKIYVTF